MALTNAMLKAMGIESDQRDQIMTAHQEVLDDIKRERDELQDKAAMVPDLEKKIEELSATESKEDEWQAKYDEEHKAFEEFKAQVEADKAKAEKVGLFKALLREVGIDDKRIEAIVKVTDLDAMEVAEGALSEREALTEKVKEEWAEFIPQKREVGASVDDPPASTADDFEAMSLTEKMQFANANPGDPKVKAWLAK